MQSLWRDTNGRQVYAQRKTLPDSSAWLPKDREARVIAYAGIERPIALVFGETPQAGDEFSPATDCSRPFHVETLTKAMCAWLHPLGPGLTLHALRHTFATWRLEQGTPLIRVQQLMGHASAQTLLRYAPVQPDPMADLLPLL